MTRVVDGVELLGSLPGEVWRPFLAAPYDLQVCSYFATGVYDPQLHHVGWLEQLRELSTFEPKTAFVKATFRRLGYLAQHVDQAGFNYLWIHDGLGFVFEETLLELAPGDVIRFARDRAHGVIDTGQPFYRTNLVGQVAMEEIEDWNSAFPTTCWLQDGAIYDRAGQREIPWSGAL